MNIMNMGMGLVRELSRKDFSNKAVKEQALAMSDKINEVGILARNANNEYLITLIYGNKLLGQPGFCTLIKETPKTIKRDGLAHAIFAIVTAMSSLNQIVHDSGENKQLRNLIGDYPIGLRTALKNSNNIDDCEVAERYVTLHQLIGFLFDMEQRLEVLCKNVMNAEIKNLLFVYRALVFGEQFDIGTVWLDMHKSIIRNESIQQNLHQCLHTVLMILFNMQDSESCPYGIREYFKTLEDIGISFSEKGYYVDDVFTSAEESIA